MLVKDIGKQCLGKLCLDCLHLYVLLSLFSFSFIVSKNMLIVLSIASYKTGDVEKPVNFKLLGPRI